METRVALKKAQELAFRQLADRCKVDLFFLCKYVLGYDIITEFTHGPLCAATRPVIFWQDPEKAQLEFPSDYGRTDEQGLPNEEEKQAFYDELAQFIPGDAYAVRDKLKLDLNQLLLLMPRGTLKSSVVTIGLICQYFLNFASHRALIDSETSTNSTGFLGEIKGHFEGNDTYRGIFHAIHGVYPDDNAKDKSTRWTNSAVDLACRRKARKEPSIDTGGVDTTKNSRHYDIIIFDDLHSEINTQTKEQIEKVKQHFRLAYSLLDPGRPAIVIGTRWSYTDVYQMIIDDHAEEFNFITRSAKSPDGKLFYPAKLNQKFLDSMREKQGSYIFSCQYMNDPVDAETAKFKRDYFQYRTVAEIEGMPINWYLTIDPGGDGVNSDFAALVLSGMDYQDNLYVRYIVKGKMTEGQIVMQAIAIYRKFPYLRRILVESLAGAGKSIIMAFKTKMKELGIWLPIQYIEHRSTAKNTRIEALAPKYEFGHVFHVKECPQIKELEDELIHFPKAKNDDVSDAFATVLEIATPPMRNQVQHEKRRHHLQRLKKLNTPRSPMIGY